MYGYLFVVWTIRTFEGEHLVTIRAKIIGGEIPVPRGWVEVGPFNYKYDGKDPDGKITAYLDGIADGSVTFDWPEEDDVHTGDYAPDLKIITIKHTLEHFDDIWYVELPSDFEETTITYG